MSLSGSKGFAHGGSGVGMTTRLVHAGPGLRVLARTESGEQPVAGWACMSLSPHRAKSAPIPFGIGYLSRYGIPAGFLVPRSSNWYQSRDMLAACRAARKALGNRPILSYGSSMGGFGAIAWARELGARRVVAISPQVSIAPEVVGSFEYRWRKNAQALAHWARADARAARLDGIECVVVYDPRHRGDARHAHLIRDAFPAQVRLFPVPYSGHPSGADLAKSGVLSWLIRSLCSDAPFHDTLDEAWRRYRASPHRAQLVTAAFARHAGKRPHHLPRAVRLIARHGLLVKAQPGAQGKQPRPGRQTLAAIAEVRQAPRGDA